MVAYITELNKENFESFTEKGLVLVDIYGTWCGPCKMISPIVDEISNTFYGKLNVGKLDVDGIFRDADGAEKTNKDIVAELGVRNIPTLLIYKDGKLITDENGVVEKLVGSITKDKLVSFVEKHIS